MVQRRTKRVDRAFFLLFSLFWKVLTERLGFRSRSESMNFGVSISHIATNTEDYVGRPMRRRNAIMAERLASRTEGTAYFMAS